MPRRLRIHQPDGFYHVTLRGNHQREIFVVDGDRYLLNTIVERTIRKFGIRIHAYCWMSNHLHFLIQVGAEPLGAPMRQIAAEYARAMQRKLETTGHFFERRYHATLVDADSYLLAVLRYIHLNPVEARIVDDPARYRWSSHHAYLGSRLDSWVTTDFAMRMLGSDRPRATAAYRALLGSEPPDGVELPAEMAGTSLAVLGSDAFVAAVLRGARPANVREKLDDLIDEACRRFGVGRDNIHSPVRDAYVTKVRAWIAYQAQVRHIATLSAVARVLGRDESTLRQAIRTHRAEVE